MKKLTLFLFCNLLTLSLSAQQTLVAGWDFAGLPATTTTTATPSSISATVGSGTIDVSAFGLGVPQGTNPERTSFAGSTLNAFDGGDTTAGSALALANSSANGKSAVFSFDMTGFENLMISFATRGTSTGFGTHLWEWSTDNVSYTALSGNNTANKTTSFLVASVDFSSATGLNDSSTAYVRLTVDGATSASGNNRFDNIQFLATPVPEPSTFALGFIGLAGAFFAMRRRK